MRRLIPSLLLVVVLLSGCASGGSTAPSSSDAAGGEPVGRWAHYDVVAYEDGLLKTLIIGCGFNDFTEVDGEIIDSAQFCFSEQRTDQPIETSLSDAGTQAIRPPSTPVEVDVVDSECCASSGRRPPRRWA